jgi:hypothetical protein
MMMALSIIVKGGIELLVHMTPARGAFERITRPMDGVGAFHHALATEGGDTA